MWLFATLTDLHSPLIVNKKIGAKTLGWWWSLRTQIGIYCSVFQTWIPESLESNKSGMIAKSQPSESHHKLNQSVSFFKILFIYSWETERERVREQRQRERQALCGEPDAGLNPRTPGSLPEPKQALNHWATQVPWEPSRHSDIWCHVLHPYILWIPWLLYIYILNFTAILATFHLLTFFLFQSKSFL